MSFHRGRLRVVYATQTGRAQDLAERLAHEAARLRFDVAFSPIDELTVADLGAPPHHVVLIASTTGDGEVPDAARDLWRALLSRSQPADALASLRVAIFGLGDSAYAKFNAGARKFAARLAQLGATAIVPRGLGDEAAEGGLDGALDAWAVALWAALDVELPLPPGIDVLPPGPLLPRCRYTVWPLARGAADGWDGGGCGASASDGAFPWARLTPRIANAYPPWRAHALAAVPAACAARIDDPPPSCDASADCGRCRAAGSAPADVPFVARVASTTRLTSPDWRQDVRHIALDVGGYFPPLPDDGGDVRETGRDGRPRRWLPGDVAVVYASNAGVDGGAAIASVARRLGVPEADLDAPVAIALRPGKPAGCERAGDVPAIDAAPRAHTTAGPPSPFDATAEHDAAATAEPFGAPRAYLRVTTPRALLTWGLDVHGTPRRAFFAALSFFAAAPEEAAKLAELGSPGGGDLYATYAARERRTFAEVLVEFPSVSLPLAYALELLPPLRPRAFSVASSSLPADGGGGGGGGGVGGGGSATHPAPTLDLCVAVVDYTTPWGRCKRGVASAWLASLAPGDAVPLLLRRGVFAAPGSSPAPAAPAPATAPPLPPPPPVPPLVMVGPGTGVASMRAIVQEREAELARWRRRRVRHAEGAASVNAVGGGSASDPLPPTLGPAHLYFGCRHAAADWLYADEMRAALASGALASYATAFSRDDPSRVVYVQGLWLRAPERAALFRALVAERGVLYVAGSAKRMPADIVDALKDILQSEGGATRVEADAYVAGMERSRRLVIEAWS